MMKIKTFEEIESIVDLSEVIAKIITDNYVLLKELAMN